MSRSARRRAASLGGPIAVATLALTAVLGVQSAACRVQVSLGTPADGGDRPFVPSEAGPCPTTEANAAITTLDPALGELRALAARDGVVVGAFARADGGSLVLLSGASRDAAPVEIARIGPDPVALAFDGEHAFVACQASARIDRVHVKPAAGDAVVEPPVALSLQPSVTSVAVDVTGRAFWTRPLDDAVLGWGFDGGAPSAVAIVARARSIAIRDATLYVAGSRALYELTPDDAAPKKIADVCTEGSLAVDGDAVVCIDDGVLRRIDRSTRAVTSLADGLGGVRDVVAARGRAFFRREGAHDAAIDAVPIDGIGGPITVARTRQSPAALATDACSLYYLDANVLRRHAL